MSASEAIFATGLRAIAAAEDPGFVALADLAGLNPKRDFRYADLSGVDLRGQDLRSFDLTGANLEGARILGARMPRTVTRRQLRHSIRTARAMAVLVGERLLSDETHIVAKVGTEVFVPRSINEALRKSEVDTRRRTQRTGAHIGDNGDLVRRRLNHAFNATPLPRQNASLVLAEPESDFDFDALLAVVMRLERAKQRPFVFLLPHMMCVEEAGERIVKARVAALDKSNIITLTPEIQRRRGTAVSPGTVIDQALADRMMVLDFILALGSFQSSGRFLDAHRGVLGDERPWLLRGARKTRESLAAALARATDDQLRRTFSQRTRRVIMVRRDIFEPDAASKIAHPLLPMGGICHVGAFDPAQGDNAEFYVVDAPYGSNLWGAFASL